MIRDSSWPYECPDVLFRLALGGRGPPIDSGASILVSRGTRWSTQAQEVPNDLCKMMLEVEVLSSVARPFGTGVLVAVASAMWL